MENNLESSRSVVEKTCSQALSTDASSSWSKLWIQRRQHSPAAGYFWLLEVYAHWIIRADVNQKVQASLFVLWVVFFLLEIFWTPLLSVFSSPPSTFAIIRSPYTLQNRKSVLLNHHAYDEVILFMSWWDMLPCLRTRTLQTSLKISVLLPLVHLMNRLWSSLVYGHSKLLALTF